MSHLCVRLWACGSAVERDCYNTFFLWIDRIHRCHFWPVVGLDLGYHSAELVFAEDTLEL